MGIEPVEVFAARQDDEKFNELVEKNKRFILYSAYNTVHRFVTESDDEWSIALIAFREAVLSYDESKGGFKGFASLVIKRRLLDYIRSEEKYRSEISVEPDSMDGDMDSGDAEGISPVQAELRQKNVEASEQVSRDSENRARDEIEAVQQLLQGYGFSFYELTECSPKAGKTKESCAAAVRTLLKSPDLLEKMRKSKTLPMKELCKESGVSRKILDRHRKYIIAAVEILNGEYPLLASYMDYIRKGLGP
ncbi:MAG: RNA polymerase subunit sigma [Lachnospiraceae bacterium]|nr:RNA polymerase subunit sigma [Lachnospiraceae bacterium]